LIKNTFIAHIIQEGMVETSLSKPHRKRPWCIRSSSGYQIMNSRFKKTLL